MLTVGKMHREVKEDDNDVKGCEICGERAASLFAGWTRHVRSTV